MSFSGFDISTATNIYLGSSQCSEIYIGSTKLWPLSHDYSRDYLTFTSLENGNDIGWTDSGNNNSLQYSIDDGTTWSTLASGSTVTLNTDDKVLFKATGLIVSSSWGMGKFSSTKRFNVEGNIMSLTNGDNFIGVTTISNNYQFMTLFASCTNLVNTNNLILPATTLADYCYYRMFILCSSLATAPVLPATTLAAHCYRTMFGSCSSLTTAPELPATTLVTACYDEMFINCSSLTTAPELPATTLASSCYANMFYSCSSLTTAPELPATTLVERCYSSMFQSCSSLTTAPELPATTLVDSCYRSMFWGCTNLNYIKCLATDISASTCTSNWVRNVSGSGTFIKDASMTGWTTGNNGIPSGWTIQNA